MDKMDEIQIRKLEDAMNCLAKEYIVRITGTTQYEFIVLNHLLNFGWAILRLLLDNGFILSMKEEIRNG